MAKERENVKVKISLFNMQYSYAHFRIHVEKKDFTDFQTELFLHFLIKFPHNTVEIHSYSCLVVDWSFQLYSST